jgi:hypothetical protein
LLRIQQSGGEISMKGERQAARLGDP